MTDEIIEAELVDESSLLSTDNKGAAIGRPSKFSPELGELLITAVKENVNIVSIAATLQVSPSTVYRWLRRGEAGDPAFEDFYVRFTAARQWLADEMVQNLRDAASMTDKPHSVRAADTLITKFYPKQFANVEYKAVQIEQNINGIDLQSLSAAERRELLKAVKVAKAIAEGVEPQEIQRLLAKMNPIEVKVDGTD